MDSLWARPGTSSRERSGPSLLAAAALTSALLAIALVAGTAVPDAWWRRAGERPVEEHVTYVAPPVVPLVVPPVVRPTPVAPPAVTSPTGARAVAAPRVAPMAPSAPAIAPVLTAPRGTTVDTGGSARGAVAGRSASAAAAGGAAAGAAGAAGTVRGPTLFPMPLRVGAELPQSAPLTMGQRDSILRAWRDGLAGSAAVAKAIAEGADARARASDAAARSAAPYTHPSLKVSVKVLSFGGPSPAQRKADSTVDADVRARLASVADRARARADSARRDSLRLAHDQPRAAGTVPRRDSL